MTTPQIGSYADRLTDIFRYVYGTTRLSDGKISLVKRGRSPAAMDAGVKIYIYIKFNYNIY